MTVVTVTVDLVAPPVAVWKAWTDQETLASWFWPSSFATTCEVDPVVGGTFRIASPVAGIGVGGRFSTVTEPTHLTFTWQWDGESSHSLVEVTLLATRTGTQATVIHSGLPTAEAVTDHDRGWRDCLERLPTLLAVDKLA